MQHLHWASSLCVNKPHSWPLTYANHLVNISFFHPNPKHLSTSTILAIIFSVCFSQVHGFPMTIRSHSVLYPWVDTIWHTVWFPHAHMMNNNINCKYMYYLRHFEDQAYWCEQNSQQVGAKCIVKKHSMLCSGRYDIMPQCERSRLCNMDKTGLTQSTYHSALMNVAGYTAVHTSHTVLDKPSHKYKGW